LDINHPLILRMFRSMTTEKAHQEALPEKVEREEEEAAEAASEEASEEAEAVKETAKVEVATEVTDLDLRTESQESQESSENQESPESQEFMTMRDPLEVEEVATEEITSHTERKVTIKEREDHIEVETEKTDHTESLDLTTRTELVRMRPTIDPQEEVVITKDLTLPEIAITLMLDQEEVLEASEAKRVVPKVRAEPLTEVVKVEVATEAKVEVATEVAKAEVATEAKAEVATEVAKVEVTTEVAREETTIEVVRTDPEVPTEVIAVVPKLSNNSEN
jgi:hypothetical protein